MIQIKPEVINILTKIKELKQVVYPPLYKPSV